MRRLVALLAVALLAACQPAPPSGGPPKPSAAGLVPLPCRTATLRAFSPAYCLLKRNYVTPAARQLAIDVAARFAQRYPGGVVYYMDASGADGHRPMWPHLSHGDGHEIDIALDYDDRAGRPLARPPGETGYRNYEPPRPGDPVMCVGVRSPNRDPDPPRDRDWRLDDARTRTLVEIVVADPRVRRVFLEPHLKRRLGLEARAKIHFQGCHAARHDDHLHIDVL
ncbi:MAG TPA: hypothetical protein VG939_20615 [Caulobacteraceae bacterium]|nr:hypothetical protein [Caulobacteraceae bacterium]